MYTLYSHPVAAEHLVNLTNHIAEQINSQIEEHLLYKSLSSKVLWNDGSAADVEGAQMGTTIIVEVETEPFLSAITMTHTSEQGSIIASKFINQIDEVILKMLLDAAPNQTTKIQLSDFDDAIQSVFDQLVIDELIAAKVLIHPKTKVKIIDFSKHYKALTDTEKRLERVIHFFGKIGQADVHCPNSIPEDTILILPPCQWLGVFDTLEKVSSKVTSVTPIKIVSTGVFRPTLVFPERVHCIRVQ